MSFRHTLLFLQCGGGGKDGDSPWLLSDNVRQGLKSDETPTVAPLQVNHWLDVEVMNKTEEFSQVFPETQENCSGPSVESSTPPCYQYFFFFFYNTVRPARNSSLESLATHLL